jgi:hypothetical protein
MNATSKTQKAYAATIGRKKKINAIMAMMTAIQNVIFFGALINTILLYDWHPREDLPPGLTLRLLGTSQPLWAF